TGYWTNGKIFVLLYWEKSGNDYRYHGQGTTFYDNTSLMWSNIDAFTVYQDEKLLLQDHIGKDAYGTKEFTPSSVAFDLTNIKPLYHRSFKETIVGEWEHEWHMFREDEGYYVCMSYMVFSEDGTVNLLIASTMSADWAEYTLPYTFEEHGSEVLAKIGDGTKMYIKIQTGPSSTHSYETENLWVYRLIDEDGESLIVDGMNKNFMRKWNANE
ncbi:MAG: hypothetical protein II186_06600, partial [Erysipelotrichales bacterium]|nr:hypothetical protein [Erysipelotrichales bacterium]